MSHILFGQKFLKAAIVVCEKILTFRGLLQSKACHWHRQQALVWGWPRKYFSHLHTSSWLAQGICQNLPKLADQYQKLGILASVDLWKKKRLKEIMENHLKIINNHGIMEKSRKKSWKNHFKIGKVSHKFFWMGILTSDFD